MAALIQTAASVVEGAGANKASGTAGGTLTAGMPLYEDTADGNKLKAARANAATTAIVKGIALNNASSGQPITYQSGGEINLGATLVVGEVYCLSDLVAGQIVPYIDLGTLDYVIPLGVAKTASNFLLNVTNSGTAKP